MKPTALVIDDEPDIRELLSITLERMDIATRTCEDVAGAKRMLGHQAFDLCMTDMRLPDGDGLELVEWIQQEVPGTPVAVITAHGSVETAVKALKLGAFDFVSKPLDLADLRKLVTAALKLRGVSVPKSGGDARVDLIGESAKPSARSAASSRRSPAARRPCTSRANRAPARSSSPE